MKNTLERILELPPFLTKRYFHVKDGLYFILSADGGIGTVTIVKLESWEERDGGKPTGLVLWDKKLEITVGPSEWASVLASMSAKGETMETYNEAFSFHINHSNVEPSK